MLGKLFKYDFKWINKVMIIYYVIAAVLTGLTKFVEHLLNSKATTMIVIVDKILVGMLISCFFSILVTVVMRIWARFNKNTYGDESYLTHTLPVTKSQIYNAKILAAICSIIIAVVIIIASILIVYLNADTISAIRAVLDELTQVFTRGGTIGIIVAAVLLIIFEIMFIMFSGIFGIVVGNRANNKKMLRSILIGIMMYSMLSGFLLIITYIIAQVNPTVMELYQTEVPSADAIKAIIYIGLGIYILYNLGYYLVCKKILEKGVNVD